MKSNNNIKENRTKEIEQSTKHIIKEAMIMNQRTGGPLQPNILTVLKNQGVPVQRI